MPEGVRERAVPLELPDPALGVFETFLAVDGVLHELNAHLERLQPSVSELYGLPLPDEARVRIIEVAQRLSAEAPPHAEHRVRLDAMPSGGGVELFVIVGPVAPREPIRLVAVSVPGGIGTHKWRDRRLLDADRGGATALVVDDDGSVLEAARANVWLAEGDRLLTPPADGRILPGVTRARLLELAPSLGLEAREEPISLARARSAEELFLTSSVRIAASAAIERTPVATPLVERIRTALLAAGADEA